MEKSKSVVNPKFISYSIVIVISVLLMAFVAVSYFTVKQLFGPIIQNKESLIRFVSFAIGLVLNISVYFLIKFIIKKDIKIFVFAIIMSYLSLATILIGVLAIFGLRCDLFLCNGWSIFWGILYLFVNIAIPFFLIIRKR